MHAIAETPTTPELLAALGVGEVDGVFLPIEPRTLEAQGLHPPEARQQHEPDRAETCRVLAGSHKLPHYLPEMANLVGTQPALDLAVTPSAARPRLGSSR